MAISRKDIEGSVYMRKKKRRENKYERETEKLAISRRDRKGSVYIHMCVKKNYMERNV